jgi:[protein-PII] uridylyltransferase
MIDGLPAYHLEIEAALRSWAVERETFALAALGSFARGEMVLFSDVDALILMPDDAEKDSFPSIVRGIQKEVRQAHIVVRTVEECISMIDVDVRSWFALFESRYVRGDRGLFRMLKESLWTQVRSMTFPVALARFRAYATNRQRQYGDSVKLLEPNVKNSLGALRDLHALYHYALMRWMETDESRVHEDAPSFDVLAEMLPLPLERIASVQDAWRFFLCVRETMHREVGYLHDTLEYDLQRKVAEILGYGSREEKESVETFMRRYYEHARNVRYAFELLFITKETDDNPVSEVPDTEPFVRKGGVLHLQDGVVDISDSELIGIFERYQSGEVELGSDVIRAIDDRITFSASGISDEALSRFDRLLTRTSGVARTLRKMNDLSVLGLFIPEFAELVHFFQHNIYHYYTADEHTLIAIEHCESHMHEDSPMGETLRSVPDVSVLYYAILFHDIAKSVDLVKHEIVGAEMAVNILKRIGRVDIVDDVQFLVRYHLMMEQVAFRRNYHDSTTLDAFCELVGSRRRLDLLFLLTYSDMSALNPTVWTDWKQVILLELKTLAEKRFVAGDWQAAGLLSHADGRNPSMDAESRVNADDMQTESERPSPEEQQAITQIDDATEVMILFAPGDSYTEATVLGKDAPFFLARVAAVFMSCDASIIHARIDTWKDGIVRDRFRLVNIADGRALPDSRIHDITQLMHRVWSGEVDTESLYERHRKKWKRRIGRNVNPSTRIDVEYHAHLTGAGREQTIIDVFAPDAIGLLYKLTQRISSFHLNILVAKIATRVDGVVDSFYVTAMDGRPFDDPREQDLLRESLLECVRLVSTR